MKTCTEIRNRCYLLLDEALEAPERAEVEAHLSECAECSAYFAHERTFLSWITESGQAKAPDELRVRIEDILETGDEAEPRRAEPSVVSSRRRRPRWVVAAAPLAAAAVLVVLLVRPGADRGGAAFAAGFAADHEIHAIDRPSASPFTADFGDAPSAPRLARGQVRGLSRCVVDGNPYAHYVYSVNGDVVSVYIPVEGSSVPQPGRAAHLDATTVMTVEDGAAAAGAILVSDLSEEELAELWSGA